MSTSVMARREPSNAPRAWQSVSVMACDASGAQPAAKPVTPTPRRSAAVACASARALPIASWKQSWK